LAVFSKAERKFMEVTIERPEQAAVPMDRSAIALGLDEFSLFSRIQTGEIKAARARSGEMVIPRSELEHLAGGPVIVHPAQEGTVLPDRTLGIQSRYGGLSGNEPRYTVPGFDGLLRENEIGGYRAAASAIAHPLESLKDLNRQLDLEGKLPASCDFEIKMSPTELWEVRSALLNLNQGEILLCQRGGEYAVIERFNGDSPYAIANGDAQMLWKGDHAQAISGAFKDDARLTLEFMASNLTAKAQKIIWEQYPDYRPGHIVAAITERCHQAIVNEETISQNQRVSRGISI
jgi:hypothetical protein